MRRALTASASSCQIRMIPMKRRPKIRGTFCASVNSAAATGGDCIARTMGTRIRARGVKSGRRRSVVPVTQNSAQVVSLSAEG